nr:hypothetical protein [Tanacetum cinerariifolium]
VPNPSESEGENGCDLLACFTTFSNILFDDEYEFDSDDDQLLHNEDFPKEIFSNPLFEEEINSMRIDQHHFNAESDLVESKLNQRLLHDDLIPLLDTPDFSYEVRTFLPFFTYPVTSLILLYSGSENKIFDPSITINRFYSFKPGLSHRCGTFKKFNTHCSHLNESPMEMLFSTCSPMDQ